MRIKRAQTLQFKRTRGSSDDDCRENELASSSAAEEYEGPSWNNSFANRLLGPARTHNIQSNVSLALTTTDVSS